MSQMIESVNSIDRSLRKDFLNGKILVLLTRELTFKDYMCYSVTLQFTFFMLNENNLYFMI